MLYQLSHIREDAVHYTSQMLSPGSSGARLLGSAETAQPVTLRVNKFLALAHHVLVGDTGIEPVTSSVSGKRAPAAPIAHCCEVGTGFEPVYTALQAVASPLGQPTVRIDS